jgi:hypothetical protein
MRRAALLALLLSLRAERTPTLIQIAYGYEQLTKHRRPPVSNDEALGLLDTRHMRGAEYVSDNHYY